MKEMKRFLSLLLCLVMLVGVLPVNALAAAPAATENSAPTEAPLADSAEESDTLEKSSVHTTEPTESEVIAVTGITLDQTALEVGVGAEPVTLTATVTPEDATDKTVTWTSSEEGVASVADGVVTFGCMGEAVITATAGDFSANCTVTVGEGEATAYENSDTIYVLAGSDFQPSDDNPDTGAAQVKSILTQIQKGYSRMDGFLFMGDYEYSSTTSATESENGMNALKNAIHEFYTPSNEVYVQGNHDPADTSGLTTTGAHDATGYGVYVINEDDYMWKNSNENTIKNTAAALETYLNEKVEKKFDDPIFVITHLPLHYNMRTYYDGDGMYANYIFDVLNKAGKDGLNIIYLFGHDHSHGWDDYLGGAAIFLTKGDTINIAQNSTTTYNVEDLYFTYMNAGYVGYYGNTGSGADTTLTMTTFAITDTEVTISRYDSNGEHVLKAKGVYGGEYPDNNYANPVYAADTDVVESSYTLELNQFEPDPIFTDETTGITVTAPGITGVTVTQKQNPTYDTEKYSAYASYDITPAGYTPGDTATVTILVPAGFDASKPAVVLDDGNQIARDTDLSDGITFTTTHFSEYDVAQVDESAGVTASGYLASDATVAGNYSDPQAGRYYLIYNTGAQDTLTGESQNANQSTGLAIVENGGTSVRNNNVWYYDGTYFRYLSADGKYLSVGPTKDTAGLTDDADSTSLAKVSKNNDGTYTLAASSGDYRYLNNVGDWGTVAAAWNQGGNNNNGSKWRFYEVTFSNADPVTLTVTPASKTITNGKTATLTASVLVNNKAATSKTITWTSSDPTVATVDANGVVTGVKDGNATITATLTKANGQNVNGTVKVEIPVTVKTRTATTIAVDPMSGSVQRGAQGTAKTGSTITVTYDDDSTETVPVTVSMLTNADGSAVSTSTVGTYGDLTVTYEGQTATGYTLNVVAKLGNNYPEYPNEGAVKVNKTATGIDFQSSGIAQVEVSASGVPVQRGADVVIVIDTSSSMDKDVDGQTPSNGEKSRIDILSESLEKVLKIFQAPDDNGNVPDIDIAVIDFNGYGDRITGATLNGGYRDDANQAAVYTGTTDGNWKLISNVGLSANNFVDVTTLNAANFAAMFDEDRTSGGTNYDCGLENAYKLLQYKQEANGEEERDQYVIFLSDGTSNRYNGYENSANSAYDNWDRWLSGYWVDQDAMTSAIGTNGGKNAYPYFYNGNGTNHPHRTAEAIKGDPTENYDVIDRSAVNADPQYIAQIPGLGATIYSIGFGLADDGGDYGTIRETTVENVLKTISSGEGYYQFVKSADALDNAFAQITSEIIYAASNARYVDQMGANFNLQMKTSTYTVVENGSSTGKTLAPKIEILAYDIYTKAEADEVAEGTEGDTVTESMIGDRKGTYTVLETVTFNADGTEAYSSLNSVGPDGNTITAGSNILQDGVIYANTFWYNTNPTDVTIDGVSIPTGKDSADLTTGSTNVLPSETFYWKMGTVQTSELAMRYYVYLEGSMEGTREGGSYSTNEYATLYYDNYLENPCYKDTVSPVMAWREANVSYAFYLVNKDGEIIVNQTTGQTGSFANKIAVTNPVVYETIKLNNLDEISSIEVASNEEGVLPVGYELYDMASVYTIKINSNSTGSWTIEKGNDKVASTYVTQFDKDNASAYSNDLLNGVDASGNTVVTGNDYTHTVVWFAVLWKVQALPDTVVIDYGLPVDISVLGNDMFGENGKLAGVGVLDNLPAEYDTIFTETMQNGFANSYTGIYGDASVNGNKVRYTPATMQMNGYEKFAYAVNYTGSGSENDNKGYYYDTVTVIPATSIYYEDSFLTYTGSGTNWVDEGTAITGATQDEDRPGAYSLTDANNIYGYDRVNLNMSTYSLGTAKKVTVNASSYATATFTFAGTGFDVISMTSDDTGVLIVQVFDEANKQVAVKSVDTYYGYDYGLYNVTYTYTNGTWVKTIGEKATNATTESKADTTNEGTEGDKQIGVEYAWVVKADGDALYQVPVIQVKDLNYGKYTAVLTASYADAFNHAEDDSYDLYIDAVRIYDPANDGAADGSTDTTIEDAYKADGEGWPSYIELRNKIIAANSFDDVANDALTDDMEGLVFIDGDAEVGDAQIADYISYGPNNEVYLARGQRVAFLLDLPANVANVHIGIKSADGNTGTYTITNIAQSDTEVDNKTVKKGTYYGAKTYTVATTTDMYYDLTGWKGDIIVISNTGDRYNTNGVISLTNIKFTYTSDPYATDNAKLGTLSLDAGEENPAADPALGSVYMTPNAAKLTVHSLNAAAKEETPDETVPEETTPEVEETQPEETIPEETEPAETVPEETTPEVEETEPEITEPEEDQKTEITAVIEYVVNRITDAFSKLLKNWFR